MMQLNIFSHVLCSLASRWCYHEFGVVCSGHCNNDLAGNTQRTPLLEP